jgi:hypothetical protein
MKTAVVIEVDGSVRELERASEVPTLEELHKAVGGYIEVVRVADPDMLMIVNEEGWVLDPPLPLNVIASCFYGGPSGIAGPVVMLDRRLLT